jgi:nucleoid DNA-binding protein
MADEDNVLSLKVIAARRMWARLGDDLRQRVKDGDRITLRGHGTFHATRSDNKGVRIVTVYLEGMVILVLREFE